MTILFICGLVSLIFGIMFLFSPDKLKKFSNYTSRMVIKSDEQLIKFRIGIGICMISIATVCFFLIYYFIKKY